jgi:non-canonical (house-cleaning) NTP pyrophosphatase
MIIVVGTQSERKIDSIKKIFIDISKQKDLQIVPCAAKSQVSETPWDKETFTGAKNRAYDCKTQNHDADYFIGLESGLVERYGHIYEEAWSCVIDKEENEYFGYSSGLKVPDYLLEKMKEHNLPHYLIFAKLNDHFDKDINSDTWGQYSGDLLLREISLEESLRNALVQIFASQESYYKRK